MRLTSAVSKPNEFPHRQSANTCLRNPLPVARASASTLSTSRLRQYKDRLGKTCRLKLNPPASSRKAQGPWQNFVPLNLPAGTPGACRGAVPAGDRLMAFHRNSLQFILIWTARDFPNFISARQGTERSLAAEKFTE